MATKRTLLDELQDELTENQQRRDELNNAIKEEKRKQRIGKLEPLRKLAERLHDTLCPYNHCDGCGWLYEKDSWEGTEHSRWLNHVFDLTNPGEYSREKPVKIETIEKILDFIETNRKTDPEILYILRNRLGKGT